MKTPPSDMSPGFIHKSKNGDFEVVEYINSKNVIVRFIETGFKTTSEAGRVRAGRVKDKLRPSVFGVGYIGDGKHKTWMDGRKTDLYRCWQGMLSRCYSEDYQLRNPTYLGCSVCEDWHNFQNFAEWMVSNDFKGKQLDKDIKIPGNKTYSPDTCTFVSCKENVVQARARSYEFVSPDGDVVEVYNLREFCKSNNLNAGNMQSVFAGKRPQHKGWRVSK